VARSVKPSPEPIAGPAVPVAAIPLDGERLKISQWEFVKGVVGLDFLPDPDRPEIAFAGRSNVGKSSLLNALTGRKALARASNTPGRTQELNFFTTSKGELYLVDMPGYGYAEAPKAKVEAWTQLIRDYFRGRVPLKRVYVLIDSRHGLKTADYAMLDLLDDCAVQYQGVLTKTDKLRGDALAGVYADTLAILSRRPAAFPILLATSAEKGDGLPELRDSIAEAITAS
jgi:GTP-binding protein